MTRDEFQELEAFKAKTPIDPNCLENLGDRSLMVGYTKDRRDFHVYLEEGVIHRIIYDGNVLVSHLFGDTLFPEDCSPDKRAYPNLCDFEFCKLLLLLDVHCTFTDWDIVEALFSKTFRDFKPKGTS